jgi:hypothetical protein
MPFLLAQSGLFQVSIVFMYVIYGLPLCAMIALVVAIVRHILGHEGRRLGLRRTIDIFTRTFGVLTLGGAVLVVVACIWAEFAIGPR